MAVYHSKRFSWGELRPLRLRFMGLALVTDILLWVLFFDGFHLFPFDFHTKAFVPNYLVDLTCFIIDTVYVTELITFICDHLRNVSSGKSISVLRAMWFRVLILFFSIFMSWALSMVYRLIGWENSEDGMFTTLTCTILSLFIGELYFGYTFTFEVVKAEEMRSALQNKIILNNHFELNTLYQLKALLRKDPVKADEMLDSMSEYHKYILSSTKYSISPVSKEIEFFNAYIKIMKHRYPEGFETIIDDGIYSIEKKVPIMSFQIIGENVFKHNSIDKDNKIIIHIFTDDNGKSVSIENNIVPTIGDIPSSKTGLKLIQEYYTGLGLSIKVVKTDTSYRITLPLI